MPIPDDNDIAEAERFFESLAGRGDDHVGARNLREALMAEEDVLREAATMPAPPMAPREQVSMEAIKQRLIASGVFAKGTAPRTRDVGIVSRLGNWIFGSGWQRPLALAASVLLVSVITMRAVLVEYTESQQEVYRGPGEPVLVAADPRDAAMRLVERIEAAGGRAVAAQINVDTWMVAVEVEDPSRAEVVRQVLREAGIKPDGVPPYRVKVRSK